MKANEFIAAAKETARTQDTPEANSYYLGALAAEKGRKRMSSADSFFGFYKLNKTNKESASMQKKWLEGYDAYKALA